MIVEWDILRDDEGNPVTITPLQMEAVWRVIRVWGQVCRKEESHQADGAPGADYLEAAQIHANMAKSRLLGRMLIDGRPPLEEKPPHIMGACGYHLVEPDLSHYYLEGGGPIPIIVQTDDEGNLVRNKDGHLIVDRIDIDMLGMGEDDS